ncbi:MAG: DUF4856 domain-containing protein [Alphaproteobacteria bacterium]|nr:DUF4856 domain-containing protein [Alphaproteobacteria bacterium]
MRAALLLLVLGACPAPTPTPSESDADTDADSDTDTDTDTDADADPIVVAADRYAFPSRTDPSVDSAVYDGQVMRQLLIADLSTHIGGLTDRLNATFIPDAGDVEAELAFYFDFDSVTSGGLTPLHSPGLPLHQATYDAVSVDKDLNGKIAGNDSATDHADWSTSFTGFAAPGVTTPESLVRHWFAALDAQAVAWSAGTYPLDPSGAPVAGVHLTDDGLDLQQLVEKFLRGAVALSQGGDDYLDDDVPGKGLLSSHADVEAGEPYTPLEHAWDEGWGYFGGSRGYGGWTDMEIAQGAVDVDVSGTIDLHREWSTGASANAAKRDLGAVSPVDFTGDAWAAFHGGRELLASTTGDLTPAELDALRGYRDEALLAWERAIAATVVHYINEVLVDMGRFGTPDYVYADHAKHFSEMKGFALGFQFDPHSPLTDAQFAELHGYLADRPVLPGADATAVEAYAADLRAARALLGTVYGFAPANLGDVDGTQGW